MKIDYCQKDMILKVYPTVGGCFEEGWTVLKKHFLVLLLIVIIGALIDVPLGVFQFNNVDLVPWVIAISSLQFFGFIYYALVVTPFNYGIKWMFLKAARGSEPQFEEIMLGFRKFLYVLLSYLLVIGLVGVGVILLIIPGIYLACKLIFVPFLIMDKNVDPIQAVKLSFYLSKGYFWTIFGMGILSFFIIVLGIVCLFVGVFVSLTWIQASFAVLYKATEELHFKDACKLAGVEQ